MIQPLETVNIHHNLTKRSTVRFGTKFPGAATIVGEVDISDIDFGAATIDGEVDINDLDFGALFDPEA